MKQTFRPQRILGEKRKTKPKKKFLTSLAYPPLMFLYQIWVINFITFQFSPLYCSISERESAFVYLSTQTWRQAEYLKYKCPYLEKWNFSSHKKKKKKGDYRVRKENPIHGFWCNTPPRVSLCSSILKNAYEISLETNNHNNNTLLLYKKKVRESQFTYYNKY